MKAPTKPKGLNRHHWFRMPRGHLRRMMSRGGKVLWKEWNGGLYDYDFFDVKAVNE